MIEYQSLSKAVGPAAKDDDHVAGHLLIDLAHSLLGTLDRGKGFRLRAQVGIAAAWGNIKLKLRPGRRAIFPARA
jgi:hypothetical protein